MTKRISLGVAFLIALSVLLISATAALADSAVGKWSGSFGGEGRKSSASATFRSDGSVTLRAMGLSASGSYGGGSIHVSAYGYSVSLSYSVSGDRMTISGSKGAYSGRMSLKRVGGGSSSSADEEKAKSVYARWSAEADGTAYDVRLYLEGFLYWAESPAGASDESGELDELAAAGVTAADSGAEAAADSVVFGARLAVSDGQLVLTPLDEDAMDVPALFSGAAGEDGQSWTFDFVAEDDLLTLSDTSGELLTLTRSGDSDRKPAEALFWPYIALKKGDRGEAVQLLQEALIEVGYLSEAADGVFGGKTQSALKAFETASNLEPDGIADLEVFSALYGDSSAQ
jgi:hypothetical protein